MKTLGNILWLIFGGFFAGLAWILAGCLWCITILGIPVGKQCFKLAKLSFCPFGKRVVDNGGTVSCLVNVLWMLITGIEMAGANIIAGLILCVTIIGIPFGKQFFKLARLSLSPFGMDVADETEVPQVMN